ncbi:hypothetical protein Tco_0811143 [Tanacetum coccineum]
MIPLTEGRALRIMPDGKRPHPQTPLKSSGSPSPAQNQEEIDPVDNITLDPIVYINQLPPIEGRESPEFKQTKGILTFFGAIPLESFLYCCFIMAYRSPLFTWFGFPFIYWNCILKELKSLCSAKVLNLLALLKKEKWKRAKNTLYGKIVGLHVVPLQQIFSSVYMRWSSKNGIRFADKLIDDSFVASFVKPQWRGGRIRRAASTI